VLEFFSTLPSCFVGIEACPTAHHWSRELRAIGHTVRLMPPSYVKADLKRSKNDANDAEAICEASDTSVDAFCADQKRAPTIRPDAASQPTATGPSANDAVDAIRGHLAEFGIISAKGRNGTAELFKIIADEKDGRITRGRTVQPRCSCPPTRRDRPS